MGLLIYRAPATWWGIPNTIGYYEELDLRDVGSTPFPAWGYVWRKVEIKHAAWGKSIVFLLEHPTSWQGGVVENYDETVSLLNNTQTFYLKYRGEMMVKFTSNFAFIHVIQPPASLDNAVPNTVRYLSYVPYFYFISQYPTVDKHLFMTYDINLKSSVMPNGSFYYNFAYANIFLTIDEIRNAPAVCTLFWQDRDEPYFNIDKDNIPVSLENNLQVNGYVAIKPLEGRFHINTQNFAGMHFVVETPLGLRLAVGNPIFISPPRPMVLRKVFKFIAPTSYTRSGSPIDVGAGTYKLSWDFFSCNLETYQPFDLGDIIIVVANDTYFVYKVNKVEVQYQPEGYPIFKVWGINLIDDDASVVECEIIPHLLPVGAFLNIAKALTHFPKNIVFPTALQNVILVDEQKRTFKTLREFIDYLQIYFFQSENFFVIYFDEDFNLVVTPPAGVSTLPNLPLLEVKESVDIRTPTVVVTPHGFIYNPTLLAQRGVVISTSFPTPAKKVVDFRFIGYAFYPINQPIQINETEIGYVSDINWEADASGNVNTNLQVVVPYV